VSAPAAAPSFDLQAGSVRRILSSLGGRVRVSRVDDVEDFARRHRLAPRGGGDAPVVVGDAVGAELGRPPAASHALVLTTARRGLVEDGAVRCVGAELDRLPAGGSAAVAQVVLLAHRGERPPDRLALEATQFLAGRLPGYMTRSVPGRLWMRVSRDALAAGMRLSTIGGALVAAYRMDFPEVEAAEAVLVAGDDEAVGRFDPVAAEARVVSGRHRKLSLAVDGVYECPDLACDACDERAVCDALREITVRYRRRRGAG